MHKHEQPWVAVPQQRMARARSRGLARLASEPLTMVGAPSLQPNPLPKRPCPRVPRGGARTELWRRAGGGRQRLQRFGSRTCGCLGAACAWGSSCTPRRERLAAARTCTPRTSAATPIEPVHSPPACERRGEVRVRVREEAKRRDSPNGTLRAGSVSDRCHSQLSRRTFMARENVVLKTHERTQRRDRPETA